MKEGKREKGKGKVKDGKREKEKRARKKRKTVNSGTERTERVTEMEPGKRGRCAGRNKNEVERDVKGNTVYCCMIKLL